MQRKNILVMGIGNYLMGDEGLGVHTIEQLITEGPLEGVDYIDGGTGGFYLLEYFEQYEHVILIDATLDNNPVGTIRAIRPRFAADFPQAMSTHDIGLKDLISALQLLDRMPEVYLFVVSIATIQQQGIEMTDEITAVIEKLKYKIKDLIRAIDAKTTITLTAPNQLV
jgi:hydrogenase maturation protease